MGWSCWVRSWIGSNRHHSRSPCPRDVRRDPDGLPGLANFTSEMVQRGCGDWDSREFLERLESLGADHSSSATAAHTSYSAAMLSENLLPTITLHAPLVRQPLLPVDQLEDARNVCLLEIQSLEDDLAQRTIQELKSRTYPRPYGLPSSGSREGINAIGMDDIRHFVASNYIPNGAVLSVAGNFDFDKLVEHAESMFGDWQPLEQIPAPNATTAVGSSSYSSRFESDAHCDRL